MTYILCKNVITKGKETGFLDKVDMMKKLDVFLLCNRITQENYTELTELMAARLLFFFVKKLERMIKNDRIDRKGFSF